MSDQVQQAAPELTDEQKAQQAQMEATMRQQQEQLQMHINQEIQKGVQMYNLDVQRLTVIANGLESLAKIETSELSESDYLRKMAVALRLKFEQASGIYVNPQQMPTQAAQDVSHETF